MFSWLVRFFRWLLSLFRWRTQTQPAEPMTPGFLPSTPSPPLLPGDPLSRVRHPRSRRPGGRIDAVAVEEPEDEEALVLIGHH
jgi:hypothetical protein